MINTQLTLSVLLENQYLLYALQCLFKDEAKKQLINKDNDVAAFSEAASDAESDIIITEFSISAGTGNPIGFEEIEKLIKKHASTKVIVITSLRNAGIIRRVLDAGVSAIISHSDPVDEAIKACRYVVSHKKKYLSPTILKLLGTESVTDKHHILTSRELEVVYLFTSGLTLAEIASIKNRSISTISSQKWSAMKRLGVSNNAELIRYAYSQGIIS